MLTPEQIAALPEKIQRLAKEIAESCAFLRGDTPVMAHAVGPVLSALADANLRIAQLDRDGCAPEGMKLVPMDWSAVKGKVLVEESDLRDVLGCYASQVSCWNCEHEHTCPHANKLQRNAVDECYLYLLAHFGLAPEPEVAPSKKRHIALTCGNCGLKFDLICDLKFDLICDADITHVKCMDCSEFIIVPKVTP